MSELYNYVRQQLEAGVTPEVIKKDLLIKGWSNEDIDKAIASLINQQRKLQNESKIKQFVRQNFLPLVIFFYLFIGILFLILGFPIITVFLIMGVFVSIFLKKFPKKTLGVPSVIFGIALYALFVEPTALSCSSFGCIYAGFLSLPILPILILPFPVLDANFATWGSFSLLQFPFYNLILLKGILYGIVVVAAIWIMTFKMKVVVFEKRTWKYIGMGILMSFVLLNSLLFLSYNTKNPKKVLGFCASGYGNPGYVDACSIEALYKLASIYGIKDCAAPSPMFPFTNNPEQGDPACIMKEIKTKKLFDFNSYCESLKPYHIGTGKAYLCDFLLEDVLRPEKVLVNIETKNQLSPDVWEKIQRCESENTKALYYEKDFEKYNLCITRIALDEKNLVVCENSYGVGKKECVDIVTDFVL